MTRLVERDTSTLSDLKQSPAIHSGGVDLQERDLYLTGTDLNASSDEANYYLQAYYPEVEPCLTRLCRATSSSIDADPNPLSTLLLDDISERVGSFLGTITRKLHARSAFPADEELFDWDAAIEAAPSRPSTTINVSIDYVGRSRPIPVDDSWE